MKTLHTNTNMMAGQFRPDTYSTYVWHEMIDIDSEIEHYKEMGLEITGDDIDIDYDSYKTDLGNWLVDWIIENLNDELEDFVQFVEPNKVEMISPREYNYYTDSINIDVDFDNKKLRKWIDENEEGLDKFLEKYKSCDGFISYTPSSYYQLVNEKDEERVVMCCIDYMLQDYMDGDMSGPLFDFDYDIVYNNLKLEDEKQKEYEKCMEKFA